MICPHCRSESVRKKGIRSRVKGPYVQEMSCNSCGKYYSCSLGEDLTVSEIKPGKILFFKSKKAIKIHAATDIHYGANEHDKSKFGDFIDEVYSDPDARWFLNGDNIELIPPNYKISQRGQEMEPDEQHINFIRLVEKIADKLLFVRGGNHDYIRSANILGFDVSKVMAESLKVPYYRLPGYTKIIINDKEWNLVSGHGKSGAKNGDMELDKMAAVYSDGDVFFLGHNHQLYSKPIDSIRVDGEEEVLHRRWYCRGGSFLMYADYARYSFFPMIRTGWVTMEFKEDKVNSWTN